MAEPTRLLYLEPDDEITTVVRRLREADAHRVVLVSSGRSKPTTSVVALRLLAQIADEEGREVALVADPAARALAAEAGIAAYASVGEASAEGAVPLEPAPPRRAPIHVVRGEEQPLAVEPGVGTEAHVIGRTDETQAVPVSVPAPRPARATAGRARPSVQPRPRMAFRLSRVAIGAVLALLVVAGAMLAAVAPAATIVIVPASTEVGPLSYEVTVAAAGSAQGTLRSTKPGTATGVFSDPTPATGAVTFFNWNTVTVEVPQGTVVAAGDVEFATTETIIVPSGQFGLPIDPGEASVAVAATAPGPGGNVLAQAIDTIVTDNVRRFLRGFPNNPNRLVINVDATAGGSLNEQPEVTQEDVDAVVAAVRADLAQQLSAALGDDPQRIYPPSRPEPTIEVPPALVGTRGEEGFEISGTLAYNVPYAARDAVEDAARERMLADPGAAPEGSEILPDSIEVSVGDASAAASGLAVSVGARGVAVVTVDEDVIRAELAGMTGSEAEALLAQLGEASVELWPGWVDRVPRLGWRVEVRVEAPQASPSPAGSGGAGG